MTCGAGPGGARAAGRDPRKKGAGAEPPKPEAARGRLPLPPPAGDPRQSGRRGCAGVRTGGAGGGCKPQGRPELGGQRFLSIGFSRRPGAPEARAGHSRNVRGRGKDGGPRGPQTWRGERRLASPSVSFDLSL
uniref:Uncharacterized protein LOC110192231 n=1 Tax=Phascolarctos cinereus TaxID=38626 RepID=A0A6P5ICH8_PHACI|nr:uncharacterized protein LOC110192231 [Phascolarctos cinereus]